jgi:hypothetical protein
MHAGCSCMHAGFMRPACNPCMPPSLTGQTSPTRPKPQRQGLLGPRRRRRRPRAHDRRHLPRHLQRHGGAHHLHRAGGVRRGVAVQVSGARLVLLRLRLGSVLLSRRLGFSPQELSGAAAARPHTPSSSHRPCPTPLSPPKDPRPGRGRRAVAAALLLLHRRLRRRGPHDPGDLFPAGGGGVHRVPRGEAVHAAADQQPAGGGLWAGWVLRVLWGGGGGREGVGYSWLREQ